MPSIGHQSAKPVLSHAYHHCSSLTTSQQMRGRKENGVSQRKSFEIMLYADFANMGEDHHPKLKYMYIYVYWRRPSPRHVRKHPVKTITNGGLGVRNAYPHNHNTGEDHHQWWTLRA